MKNGFSDFWLVFTGAPWLQASLCRKMCAQFSMPQKNDGDSILLGQAPDPGATEFHVQFGDVV
jgi:hypothetical protein